MADDTKIPSPRTPPSPSALGVGRAGSPQRQSSAKSAPEGPQPISPQPIAPVSPPQARRATMLPSLMEEPQPAPAHTPLDKILDDEAAPPPVFTPAGRTLMPGAEPALPKAVVGYSPTVGPELPKATDRATLDPSSYANEPISPQQPVSSRIRAGTVLGRFVLDRMIGEGATATVWAAHHTQLGSPVAIKVFRRRDLSFGTVLGEAQAAAGIPSPNAIWVYDVGTFDGFHSIVMELCADGDRVARSLRCLDLTHEPERAAALMAQSALGVQAAHDGGIFHKDIKPANILQNPNDGRAQVTDFGLANPALWRTSQVSDTKRQKHSTVCIDAPDKKQSRGEHLTIWGKVRVGTPEFMSPEQARGLRKDLDPNNERHRRYLVAIDVYGLGATLYAILAGHPPYPYGHLSAESATAEEIMAQVIEGPPPPLRTIAPQVPRRLAAIVEKAMHRSPFDRYTSAEQLHDDLEAWRTNYPTSLEINPLVRGAVNLYRHRATASLLSLLAAITLGSFSVVQSNIEKIQAQATQISTQNDELERQAADFSTLRDQHEETSTELKQTVQNLSKKEANLSETKKKLSSRERQLRSTTQALGSTQGELESLQAEYSTTTTRLTETQTSLETTRSELALAKSRGDQLTRDLARQVTDLEATRATLASTESELQRVRRDLDAETTRSVDLEQDVEELTNGILTKQAEIENLRVSASTTEREINDLRQRLAKQRAEIRQLRDQNDLLYDQLQAGQ